MAPFSKETCERKEKKFLEVQGAEYSGKEEMWDPTVEGGRYAVRLIDAGEVLTHGAAIKEGRYKAARFVRVEPCLKGRKNCNSSDAS